jgi:phosphatidylethanolamine-binding protein (PEBP) family uncharacterized protein
VSIVTRSTGARSAGPGGAHPGPFAPASTTVAGPAPPWNDSIVHHYVFTVFALDVDRLDVSGDFTGHDVRAAMEGHVLAEASVGGTYTQNPRLL